MKGREWRYMCGFQLYIYIYQVGSLQWFSGSHNTVDGTKILQISGVPINWCRISSLNSMSSSIGGGWSNPNVKKDTFVHKGWASSTNEMGVKLPEKCLKPALRHKITLRFPPSSAQKCLQTFSQRLFHHVRFTHLIMKILHTPSLTFPKKSMETSPESLFVRGLWIWWIWRWREHRQTTNRCNSILTEESITALLLNRVHWDDFI